MQQVETITLPHDFSEFSEIIDVRSPEEFEEDHLPGAVNFPVLNNEQRKRVGTLHKSNPFEARRLGACMISANISHILATALEKKGKGYSPLVYCWRGGQRSNSLAHILRSIGWRARVLSGGYKAFRKFSCEDLKRILENEQLKLTVLSGPTGVAKTRLLKTLEKKGAQVLDLEGLANHKGSILGLTPQTQQPTQKRFETGLWNKLSQFSPDRPIFTEAESNRIGALHCPPALWKKLSNSKVINIELPIDQRAAFLLDDYPYFTKDPAHLKALLQKLIKLRGHDLISQWNRQIDSKQWKAFVESILKNHYDLAYRRAGDEKSNYLPPSATIALSDFSESSLLEAVNRLQAHLPPIHD